MKKVLSAVIASSLSVSAFAGADLYGFVKASYLRADKTVGADGSTANYTKPLFAADKPAAGYSETQKATHSSFYAGQSRFGIKADKGNTSARIEFDLDDGKNAERTRIAQIERKTASGMIVFGKKWDLFSVQVPHTYSTTTVQFFSGNTGFLTEGVEYTHKFGAFALAGQLDTPNTDVDYSSTNPAMTVKADYTVGAHNFGVAHKTSQSNNKKIDGTGKDVTATGTKLFYKGGFGKTSIAAEYTNGSNLGLVAYGALSSLALGTDASAAATNSTAAKDIEETAMYVSVKHNFGTFGVFGGFGSNEITNAKKINPTISKNTVTRVGFDMELEKDVMFFTEYTAFSTGYWNSTSEKEKEQTGSLIDAGVKMTF